METINPSYDKIQSAEYLLALANDKGKILNQTKLQKLLFIAYGQWLCQNDGQPLLTKLPSYGHLAPFFLL